MPRWGAVLFLDASFEFHERLEEPNEELAPFGPEAHNLEGHMAWNLEDILKGRK